MKMSLKQLENFCSSLNATLLKNTPYGIKVTRKGTELSLTRLARKKEHKGKMEGEVFKGSTKECYVYLVAVRDTLIDWYPIKRDEFKDLDGTQSIAKFM
jgi:hypothetical protein